MQRVRFRFRAPLVTAGALLLLGTAAYGLTAQSVGGGTIYGGQVTGTAFVDENADGAFDSGERGELGITVYAYDAAETLVGMATTALDGQYTLNVIDSTSIDLRIEFDLSTGPADLRESAGDQTRIQFVQIDAMNVDFAVFRSADFCATVVAPCVGAPVEFGDRLWMDTNGDGLQTAGEPPIPNVTVRLLAIDNTVIDVAETGSDGHYRFSSDTRFASTTAHRFGVAALAPGSEVRLLVDLSDPDLPADSQPTAKHRGGRSGIGSDAEDSDVNRGIGTTYPYFISNYGDMDHDRDIGLVISSGGGPSATSTTEPPTTSEPATTTTAPATTAPATTTPATTTVATTTVVPTTTTTTTTTTTAPAPTTTTVIPQPPT